MDEDELKSALRDAMVASSPPPPMSPAAAVAAGRSARRRRATGWGAAVAGLAVVAIAVGTVLVPQLSAGSGGAVIQAGGQSSDPRPQPTGSGGVTTTGRPSVPGSPTGTGAPTGTGEPSGATRTSWPDGQTDRTATSGPRADKSVRVLNDLGSALPPTFQAVDMQPIGDQWSGPMRSAQSQFVGYYDGDGQIWEYMATTPVMQSGSSAVGRLWIQVATKGTAKASDGSPCGAVAAAWPIEGPCSEVDAGGKRVGFVSARPGTESDLDELVVHQHDDGTLVFIGQAAEFRRAGYPALSAPVFTRDQLAALATDPKFHLD
ncbi:hypothetical protein ABZ816_09320 [Actinosynnema sp. NPDC047251]|uniref:Putative membrane protein n=1 Tax=Saccharothrix espanaensis (strain ATCC 51144 / DSM 44229 / JCM 9112 / NBRC 15066 / NRRL 15764) TaxID=1179773 RepID=K0K1A0_SACES|nr:hypothetical protein [Saccharothrix espanaensis]CCH34010.1 putative membrane protein [Saccharothrix espanaensis DSM 44229]